MVEWLSGSVVKWLSGTVWVCARLGSWVRSLCGVCAHVRHTSTLSVVHVSDLVFLVTGTL